MTFSQWNQSQKEKLEAQILSPPRESDYTFGNRSSNKSSRKNIMVCSSFLSHIETKNVKEALKDTAWINAM